MNSASTQNLYSHVEFLTNIRPYRNFENLASLQKAKEYISRTFASYGCQVTEQKWLAASREYANVIASYAPEKRKRVIVGAHYDVCGDQPGADDNASAVAGLLETARLTMLNTPDLEYGIDFVSYCLEEPPFWETKLMGSYIHSKSLKENGSDVKGMICYEMIGYFSDEPNSQASPDPELAKLYPSTGNFIIVVGIKRFEKFTNQFHAAMAENSKIDVQKICLDDTNGWAGLSDHRNYWHFDFPGLMINDTSFLRNPHYHEITDTIQTLDFKKLTAVVDSAYNGIVNL